MSNLRSSAKAAPGNSLKSTAVNGVQMYWVSGQRSLATWLPPKKLKALRNNKGHQQRLDVLQDLWFETATTKIKPTPDGEFLIASGTYPPQVKVYDYSQLSMKFERHLDSEILNFQVLSDDYSKIAFLCADRSVRLHTKFGSHYSLRIPRMGRDFAYDCCSCDLLCAASSPDLYRINLEQGRFLTSLTSQSPAINVVTQSKLHGLVACGGEDGALECFDMRVKSSVGRINAVVHGGDVDSEVTALQFDDVGGYLMAVGSSTGKVLLYDLRSSHPIRVKDHEYGSAILDIKWHQTLNTAKPKLISTDKHTVKVWDPETGEAMTSIEPSGGAINDVCVVPESGLIMLALDCSQIPSYFLPALGPVPKWCSMLDALTEEMEEDAQQTTIYDNFKFLTKEDLERLNLTNLIGTNLLRAYMHGFFIDYRLYQKAKALANPFAYEAYIEKRKQEKIEAERASRITIKRKLPKINRGLAARLLENEENEVGEETNEDTFTKKKSSKKKKGVGNELLKDERFSVLFENKNFEVDEYSQEYQALHLQAGKKQPSLIEEHFEQVQQDEEEAGISDSDVSDAPSSLDGEAGQKKTKNQKISRVPRSVVSNQAGISDSDVSDAPSSLDGEAGQKKTKNQKISRVPRLYEVKDERHAAAFWNKASLAEEDALPLEERVAALEKQQHEDTPGNVKMGMGGSREISFFSKSSAKKMRDGEPWEGNRRGIKPLGLPSVRNGFPGRSRGGGLGRGRSRGRGRGRGRGRR